MSPEVYGLLERVHGHLAVLALALLLHPVITLRTRTGLARWTVRSAWMAAGLLLVPFALGWWLYPTYREQVKPGLRADLPSLMVGFELKEHLAFYAMALAVGGAAALHWGGRHPAGRSAAWWLLASAWVCGLGAGLLGVWVAGGAQPGW